MRCRYITTGMLVPDTANHATRGYHARHVIERAVAGDDVRIRIGYSRTSACNCARPVLQDLGVFSTRGELRIAYPATASVCALPVWVCHCDTFAHTWCVWLASISLCVHTGCRYEMCARLPCNNGVSSGTTTHHGLCIASAAPRDVEHDVKHCLSSMCCRVVTSLVITFGSCGLNAHSTQRPPWALGFRRLVLTSVPL